MSGSACESEPSLCDAGMIHHQNVSAAGPKSGTPYGLVNFAEPDVKVAFWEVLPRKRLLINELGAALLERRFGPSGRLFEEVACHP